MKAKGKTYLLLKHGEQVTERDDGSTDAHWVKKFAARWDQLSSDLRVEGWDAKDSSGYVTDNGITKRGGTHFRSYVAIVMVNEGRISTFGDKRLERYLDNYKIR